VASVTELHAEQKTMVRRAKSLVLLGRFAEWFGEHSVSVTRERAKLCEFTAIDAGY
jgi:hypothetical protein